MIVSTFFFFWCSHLYRKRSLSLILTRLHISPPQMFASSIVVEADLMFSFKLVKYLWSKPLQAFTGSIVEHTHNLETNTHGKMQVCFYHTTLTMLKIRFLLCTFLFVYLICKQPSGSQPSKPVSRFKAQRR